MNTLQITHRDGHAIVRLSRGRANPLNAELVNELRDTLKQLQQDDAVKGMLLTGSEGFFSAGLDVIELYGYDEPTMRQFWYDFNALVSEMTSFDKPLVCAITGHSPAGGCLLSICADYRVMTEGKYRIGLNEIPVGITIPPTIFNLYAFWLGHGTAYRALAEGRLFSTTEAHAVGLADELTPADQTESRAYEKLAQYTAFLPDVWRQSKRNMRARLLKDLHLADEVAEQSLAQWWKPESRAVLKGIVEQLKK